VLTPLLGIIFLLFFFFAGLVAVLALRWLKVLKVPYLVVVFVQINRRLQAKLLALDFGANWQHIWSSLFLNFGFISFFFVFLFATSYLVPF